MESFIEEYGGILFVTIAVLFLLGIIKVFWIQAGDIFIYFSNLVGGV